MGAFWKGGQPIHPKNETPEEKNHAVMRSQRVVTEISRKHITVLGGGRQEREAGRGREREGGDVRDVEWVHNNVPHMGAR